MRVSFDTDELRSLSATYRENAARLSGAKAEVDSTAGSVVIGAVQHGLSGLSPLGDLAAATWARIDIQSLANEFRHDADDLMHLVAELEGTGTGPRPWLPAYPFPRPAWPWHPGPWRGPHHGWIGPITALPAPIQFLERFDDGGVGNFVRHEQEMGRHLANRWLPAVELDAVRVGRSAVSGAFALMTQAAGTAKKGWDWIVGRIRTISRAVWNSVAGAVTQAFRGVRDYVAGCVADAVSVYRGVRHSVQTVGRWIHHGIDNTVHWGQHQVHNIKKWAHDRWNSVCKFTKRMRNKTVEIAIAAFRVLAHGVKLAVTGVNTLYSRAFDLIYPKGPYTPTAIDLPPDHTSPIKSLTVRKWDAQLSFFADLLGSTKLKQTVYEDGSVDIELTEELGAGITAEEGFTAEANGNGISEKVSNQKALRGIHKVTWHFPNQQAADAFMHALQQRMLRELVKMVASCGIPIVGGSYVAQQLPFSVSRIARELEPHTASDLWGGSYSDTSKAKVSEGNTGISTELEGELQVLHGKVDGVATTTAEISLKGSAAATLGVVVSAKVSGEVSANLTVEVPAHGDPHLKGEISAKLTTDVGLQGLAGLFALPDLQRARAHMRYGGEIEARVQMDLACTGAIRREAEALLTPPLSVAHLQRLIALLGDGEVTVELVGSVVSSDGAELSGAAVAKFGFEGGASTTTSVVVAKSTCRLSDYLRFLSGGSAGGGGGGW